MRISKEAVGLSLNSSHSREALSSTIYLPTFSMIIEISTFVNINLH